MTDHPAMVDALRAAARDLNAPRDLPSTLDAIVRTAQQTIPGIDHVGISISHRDGRVETVAATDPLVNHLDELQYDLGEGPCLDAIWDHPVLLVEDAAHEGRWPRYIPRAVEAGLRAQLGLRLYIDEQALGGLNLYSTSAASIDPEARQVAELFATHAALALGRARREEDWESALYTRKVIGQAIGIVMERHGVDEDKAFSYLVTVSQATNVKLRDVAAELVRLGNQPT